MAAGIFKKSQSGKQFFLSLSEDDVRKARHSWNQAGGPQQLAQKIFLNLFRFCPDIKCSYQMEHLCTDEELIANESFQKHSKNFSICLEAIVQHLKADDERSILETAKELGVKHAELAKFDGRLLKSNVWSSIVDLVAQTIAEESVRHSPWWCIFRAHKSDEIRHIWVILLLRLTLAMKDSFYKEFIQQ